VAENLSRAQSIRCWSAIPSLCQYPSIFNTWGFLSRSFRRLKWLLFYTRDRPRQPCESRLLLFASALDSPWLPSRHVAHFPHYVLRQGCKFHVSVFGFQYFLMFLYHTKHTSGFPSLFHILRSTYKREKHECRSCWTQFGLHFASRARG
jgi:hypothetical protein